MERASTTTIGKALVEAEGRPTGFDYMRLILSVLVVLSHAPISAYGQAGQTALWDSPARGLFRLILPMFFSLSGFLVAGSMYRSKTLIKFLGLRFIRIYPALSVEVFLSAFLIGPMVTSVPLSQYFSDPLFFRYLVNVTGDISYLLPGVFDNIPYPQIVNGQLGTVRYELYCYILLALLILIGAKSHRIVLPIGSALLFAVVIAKDWFGGGEHFVEYFRALGGPFLVVSFLLGVNLFAYRDIIPHSRALTTASFIVSFILLGVVPYGSYLGIIVAAYFTVAIGVANPKKSSVLKGADYSYGIFLYGFPVQQLLMATAPFHVEWYTNFAFGVAGGLFAAILSWHFVEKPAMKLKWVLDALENRWLTTKTKLPFVRRKSAAT